MAKQADVCDMCDTPGKAWTLTAPNGDRFYASLCDRHGIDLRFVCKHATPAKKGPFGADALRAEIEELKHRD